MAALGMFTVTVDADLINGPKPDSAAITVKPNLEYLRDPDADKFYIPKGSANSGSSLPATLVLPTDVTTGTSTQIGYTVTVRVAGTEPIVTSFAAQAAGSTTSLADLLDSAVPMPVNDTIAARDEAVAAAETILAIGGGVNSGSNALTPRPSGIPADRSLIWVGTVLPVNMGTYDVFFDLTIPDATDPTAPTNLTAAMSGSSVVLNWGTATDNVGVTGYRVHRGTTAAFTPDGTTLLGSTTSALTYTDATPIAGQSYYKVLAIDAAGNDSVPSASAAPFNPFGIGVSWHAAVWAELEGGTSGATLDTVTDRSGNSRTFSPVDGTATRKPTLVTADALLNSRKAYSFDGVDDAIVTPTFTNISQPFTFVLVGERTRGTTGAYALLSAYGFDVNTAANRSGAVQGSNTNHIHNINDGTDLAGGTADKFIMVGKFNGATSTFDVNGTLTSGSAGAGTHQAARWMLGGSTGNNWYGNVRIAFAGFVAGSLTADQTAALKAGAAHYYGITVA